MMKNTWSNGNRRPIQYENQNGTIAIRYNGNMVKLAYMLCGPLQFTKKSTKGKIEINWLSALTDWLCEWLDLAYWLARWWVVWGTDYLNGFFFIKTVWNNSKTSKQFKVWSMSCQIKRQLGALLQQTKYQNVFKGHSTFFFL